MYVEVRGKTKLINEDKFFDEVIKNRYQDTPYSIVKDGDHSWSLYIISQDTNNIYGGWGYYRKKDAIKDIESKRFYNELNTQFKLHFEALNIVQQYMIDKIEDGRKTDI